MFTLNEAFPQSHPFSASNVTCFIQPSLGPHSGSPSTQCLRLILHAFSSQSEISGTFRRRIVIASTLFS